MAESRRMTVDVSTTPAATRGKAQSAGRALNLEATMFLLVYEISVNVESVGPDTQTVVVARKILRADGAEEDPQQDLEPHMELWLFSWACRIQVLYKS